MKHVGKMKNNSARIVVLYRTVPNEPNNCLVVGTNGLIDSHHDALMSIIEGPSGQEANELAELLAVRKFPDGNNVLQYLHVNGHIKKVPTSMVLMTPNSQTQLPLNELNDLIAKQKGITVNDTTNVVTTPEVSESKVVEKSNTSETFSLTPSEMRSRADALYKEAARLRKEADEIDPPKAKSKTKKVEAE
jgi:hypothetical protein